MEISESDRKRILALLASVVFIAVTTGTMINVALPFIGRHFDVTETTYGWIVTGYTLTFGIFSVVHGRLADVYGTRRLYLIGLLVFGLTAILVAFAPSIGLAIVLRLIQGAGAAALPSLGSTIISKVWPAQRRGAAMGVIIGTVGVAASIGPFLGGLLLDLLNWRAVFLFSAVAILATPFVLRLLPDSLDERRKQPLDIMGALLLGAGAAGLMFSFNLLKSRGLGAEFGGLVGLSLALLAIFVAWIRRRATPFVRPDLFVDRRYVAAMTVAALANATRFGTIVLVPILLIDVVGTSPLVVGAVLFPGALAIAVLSPPAGRWADRIGSRKPVVIGTACIGVGIVIISLTAGISVIGVAAGMTLYGVGFATIQSPVMSATSQVLPSRDTGVGMGMFMMIFFLGGAFGVAVTVALVDLQGVDAVSWFGLALAGGERFSNAIACLLVINLLGLVFARRLPGVNPEPLQAASRPSTAERRAVSGT